MLAAEIEHFLGLGDAADERAGNATASEQQAEGGDGKRLRRRPDEGEVAVAAEQVDVSVYVVIGGDGVEYEVEAPGVLLHLVGIAGNDGFVGAEAERAFLLVWRSGEDDYMGSERLSKLHTHVAQAAEADYANFHAFGDAPAPHGRVGGDASALERCGPGGIEVGRDAQDKVFFDDNALGVPPIGDASEVLVRGVEGEDHVRAELLKAGLALGAGAVGVDHAPYRSKVTGLELGDGGADLGDAADDLVAGDDGIDSGHKAGKLVTDMVEIGVADSAEQDVDLNIVFGGIAPLDRVGGKPRCRTRSGVSFGVVHGFYPPIGFDSALNQLCYG
jgi:hypothetical protein